MANASTVFALEIGYYDAKGEPDSGEEAVPTPTLSIFASAAVASKRRQGIDIEEGDLYFFAADGSPLEANFSEKPYVDAAKNKYFAGVYTLRPGSGDKLQDVINKIIARNLPQHTGLYVYKADDDEDAQWYGWADRTAMEDGIKQALRIFPLDVLKRVKLE